MCYRQKINRLNGMVDSILPCPRESNWSRYSSILKFPFLVILAPIPPESSLKIVPLSKIFLTNLGTEIRFTLFIIQVNAFIFILKF